MTFMWTKNWPELLFPVNVINKILQIFWIDLAKYVTFHEQQECGYGFPSLPLATRASADVSEWFLSTIFFYLIFGNI